jgi:hypothetical protein
MMDRFPDALLDEIRAAVNITDVVGGHVQWDAGKSNPGRRDMWANCPFHAENSPSFHAQDDEGAYHCFGCGASGDHFAFLMALSGVDFPEAVRTVAEMGGINLPDQGTSERKPARPPEQPRQTKMAPQPSAAEIRPEIVKTYEYTNRDGELLYQVCRMQRKLPDGSWALNKDGRGKWKTFLQRRPDGAGKWIWSLAAGEFMRRPGGDWRLYDQKKFAEGMETRFFPAGADHTIYRLPAVEIAIAEGKTILITEGEKDADTAVDLGMCGTTNSSGSKHWTDVHAACFCDADVVICLDNDAAGDRADALAKSMKGIAKRIRVLNFAEHVPGFDHKGDITDWVEKFGGTADQLRDIIARLPNHRPGPPASKFNAVSLKAIGTGIGAKHTWLVHDMIELGGSCALAGFSQSGKSFLVIKLTFAIVMGEQFFGRDVLPGMVVYQLGEGEGGFEKRLEGFMKDKGLDTIEDLPLVILPKKINLFASDDDCNALIEEVKAWSEFHDQPCRMVVIDTFNKATRGMNEISGQDLGKVIERVERIATATGATVVVIDHLSAGGRIRGHGSKTDDMTNTVRVEKDEKKVDNNGRPIRYMILSKNKDGEAGGKVPFVLRQVVNGFDDKGRPITTCVVEPPDGSQEELEKSGRLPINQATVLRALRDATDREGIPAPEDVVGVPSNRHVVPWKVFMAELRRRWQYSAPENEPEAREKEIHRVVTDAGRKLQLAGFIDRDNSKGIVWWTGKTDRPIPKPRPIEPAGAGISQEVKREYAESDVPF